MAAAPTIVQIFAPALTDTPCTLEVAGSASVGRVKVEIEKALGIAPEKQRLIFNGKELEGRPMKVELSMKRAKPAFSPREQEVNDPSQSVFLGNLAWTVDEASTRALFKDCGEIEEIYWVTDKETGKFYGTG